MNPNNNNSQTGTLMEHLKRKFYRGSLDFESEAAEIRKLTWSQQEEILNDTVNNILTKKFPIKKKFTRLFIKKLIHYISEEQEVHDDLYKLLCLTMNEDDTFHYRHYLMGDSLMNRIIIKETNNLVVNGTTGMRTWEASLMLVDWALCNKEVFMKNHVLELGSGVGFAGITIAKYCHPHSVVMSDCHSDVLSAVEDNININFTGLKPQAISYGKLYSTTDVNIGVMHLDWMDLSNISPEICPDVVVGADIVYDPSILEPLLNIFSLFLTKNSKVKIFIAGVIRNKETYDMFLEKIDTAKMQVKKISHKQNVFIEWHQPQIEMYLIEIKL